MKRNIYHRSEDIMFPPTSFQGRENTTGQTTEGKYAEMEGKMGAEEGNHRKTPKEARGGEYFTTPPKPPPQKRQKLKERKMNKEVKDQS